MALAKQVSFCGLNVPAAYHRIVSVAMDRDRNAVSVKVAVFANAVASTSEFPLRYDSYRLPYAISATVAGVYTQLKTLPEFAGAVDV